MNESGRETDDLDALAEGYVLGTLPALRRREVESRMAQEPALRAAVDALEAGLGPLAALADPVEPSAGLWPRIAASIAPLPALATGQARRQPRWWESLALWRVGTAVGFACTAAMAVVLAQRDAAPAPGRYVVVLVAPQDRTPGWVVQASGRPGHESVALVPLGAVTVPAGKALQFWTKADAWSGPRSLGLVAPGAPVRVDLDGLPPLEANQLFELTLEPAQGSPIDRPTGPIQFIGRAVKTGA